MPGSSSPERDDPSRTRGAGEALGPPWILGRRGAPLRAPENSLVGFERALELGANGVTADVRRTRGGDLVVFADALLDRTTDGHGPVDEHGLVELAGLDAGGWFAKRFAGEPIPVVDELLEREEEWGRDAQLWLRVHEPGVADALARRIAALRFDAPAGGRAIRLATDDVRLSREAVDAGLPVVHCANLLDEAAWDLSREPLVVGVAARSWTGELAERHWSCERWVTGVAAPDDLLRALRGSVSGVVTNEVERAASARRLLHLVGEDARWPLDVPSLAVEPDAEIAGGGWRGHWTVRATLHNPFPHRVRVALSLEVRRGAFECHGLPTEPIDLGPGSEYELECELSGGSWSPGGDPRLVALFDWTADGPRQAGRAGFDATLARRRHLVADAITRRLTMLRESPTATPASMTMRRRGRELHVAIENAGGLIDATAWVRVGEVERTGARGARVLLPDDFDRRAGGVEFACGFLGRRLGDGRRELRRFGGGLDWGADPGAASRLLLAPRALKPAATCKARWTCEECRARREWIRAGVRPGLQSRLGFVNSGAGGFDSHALPPHLLRMLPESSRPIRESALQRVDPTIRALAPSDEPAALRALQRVFDLRDDDALLAPGAWSRRYFANPAGTRATVAVDEAGAILAQYAGLPQRARLDDAEAVLTQGVDSLADPDRGRGLGSLFVRVGRRFARDYGGRLGEGDVFMWGYPVREAWRVGRALLGYETIRSQVALVAPARAASAGDATHCEVREYESAGDLPPTFDAWIAEHTARYRAVCDRSREYLAWRYARGRALRPRAARRRDPRLRRRPRGGLRGRATLRVDRVVRRGRRPRGPGRLGAGRGARKQASPTSAPGCRLGARTSSRCNTSASACGRRRACSSDVPTTSASPWSGSRRTGTRRSATRTSRDDHPRHPPARPRA